jgi:hypothetical protein
MPKENLNKSEINDEASSCGCTKPEIIEMAPVIRALDSMDFLILMKNCKFN